jgi:hypothetical protein
VRLNPHFTRVHDLHPGLFSPLLFHFCTYIFRSLVYGSIKVESDILRPQMIAHPWAIVCISPPQSAKHTEEANVRPPLSDRSLPRQALKGARLSPARARTNTRVRTFAHPWAIVRPRGRLSHVTYLGHFSPFSHRFYNNVCT